MKKVGLLIFLIGIIGLMGMAVVAQDEAPLNPIITPENVTQIQELRMLGRGYIYDAKYSPDGKYLAISTSTGIWLYNANNLNQEPRRFIGAINWSLSIAFSPDGHYIASGSGSGSDEFDYGENNIYIWDIETGQLVKTLVGHTNNVLTVKYNSAGNKIISGSQDKTIRIWDVETETELEKIDEIDWIRHITYISSEEVIFYTTTEGIKIRDAQTGDLLNIISGTYYNAEFSSDGQYVVFSDNSRYVKIATLEDIDNPQILFEYTDTINDIAYSPDEQSVAIGFNNGEISIWNLLTYTHVVTLLTAPPPSLSLLLNYPLILDYSRDGSFIVSVRKYNLLGDIKISNIQAKITYNFDENTINSMRLRRPILFSNDSQSIYSGEYKLSIFTNEITQMIDYSYVNVLGQSLDGRFIVFIIDNKIIEFDVETSNKTELNIPNNYEICASSYNPMYHKLAIVSIYRDISPADLLVQIWDLETDSPITIESPANCNGIALSPDGNFLAYAGRATYVMASEEIGIFMASEEIGIWDLQSAMKIKSIAGYYGYINHIVYSPDGRYLLVTENNVTSVLDIESETLVRVLPYTIMRAIYNYDGSLIIGMSHRNIYIFSGQTGEHLSTILAHTDFINNIVASRDGRYIASTSDDGTIRIWGIPPSSTP